MSTMRMNPETGYPEIMPDSRIPPGGHTLGRIGGLPGLQPPPLDPRQQIQQLTRPPPGQSIFGGSMPRIRPTPPKAEGLGVSSFVGASSNDMQRMLNRGSISQGSVSEVQQMIDSPQPIAPPANPIIDVLGTGNVLEPGSSNFAAPSQGDYNFGVQDTFTPPSMMSEYQSAFPQLPSFGQAMPVQQALPQGGLGSLGQTPLPLQQFNVSGSFNAPPIKSPYV